MWLPSRRQEDLLSRYWSALVRGAAPDDLAPLAAELDPALVATVARIRQRAPHQPDPAFVARLESDLLAEVASPFAHSARLDSPPAPPRNGSLAPSPRHWASPPIDQPRRWEWGAIAAALILIFALAVALLFVIPRRYTTITNPAPLIATPGTPVSAASPTPPVAWHVNPTLPADVRPLWKAAIPQSTAGDLVPQLAFDPSGNVWAIDGANSRFVILSPDGALLDTWGQGGTGDGQFAFQRAEGDALGGIAFAPDGGFYVADSQNARVQQFAPDRTFLRAWGGRGTGQGQFLEPIGVAVDPRGTVYVIDDARDDVQVFDASGAFLFAFGGPGKADGEFDQPGWGAFDPQGNFWIADTGNGRLQQFDGDGQHQLTIDHTRLGAGVIDAPRAVATDSDGRVYVTDSESHRIQVFRPDGRWLIALGVTGNEVDSYGNIVHNIESPYHAPEGIAIDRDNNLAVLDADPGNPSLLEFQLVLPAKPPP